MNDELFGELKWTYRDLWEGVARFEDVDGYGAALDEKDEGGRVRAGRGGHLPPTRRQVEAKEQLRDLAMTLSGEDGGLLDLIVDGFEKPKEPSPVEEAKESGDEGLKRWEPELELLIDTGGKRSKPGKAQRDAWKKLRGGGKGLWDEIIEQAMVLYSRQRPMRVQIWKSTYGDIGLRRCLPEVKTSAEMIRLVRPYACRIKPAEAKGKAADIGIHYVATWHVDGFGVLIHDGKVVSVGHVELVHPLTAPRKERIEHAVFGTLGRIPDNDPMEVVNQWERPTEPGVSGFAKAKRGGPWPWEGFTRCEAFLNYCLVAVNRAEFVNGDRNAGRPRSSVAWEFAGGEFEVRVYAGRGELPAEAQARAFSEFRADEARYAAEMVQSIFEMYQEVCEIRRRNWLDRYVDDLIPILGSSDGLRDRLQLRCIHVHPPDAHDRVTLGFQFVCSWDYDGISALWREGKAREWGVWNDAKPTG